MHKVVSLKVTIMIRLALVFVVIALVSIYLAMEISKSLLVSLGKKYVVEMPERRKNEVSTQLGTRLKFARYLAEHETIKIWLKENRGAQEAKQLLREIKKISRDLDSFAVSERERILWFNGDYSSTITREDKDDSWYWDALGSKDYVYNFDHNRTLNTTKLWVNYPVYEGTNYYGVVGTGVDYDKIVEYLTETMSDQHDVILHDDTGLVKVSKTASLINSTNIIQLYGFDHHEYQAAIDKAKTNKLGYSTLGYLHKDQYESVASVAWLPMIRLYIITSVSIAEYRYAMITPFVVLQFFALLILLTCLLIILKKHVFFPLGEIVGHLERIGKLSYEEEIPIGKILEFGKVIESINTMQTGLRTYAESMQEMVDLRTLEYERVNQTLLQRDEYIKHELAIAKKIQMALVPDRAQCSQYSRLEIGFTYKAMDDLGGDLFDIIRFGKNGFGFFMIDVCGHGVAASLITAMVKVSFTTHAKWGVDAAEVMARVNAEMTELLFGMETYITACYLSFNFEDNTYQYVNAGHPPLLIKKHNEHVFRKFTLKGYFINVKSDSVYEMLRGTLDEGDQFFMYTDGVIEARKNANEMYGYERMQAILDKGATLSAQETVDLLFEDVVEYTADGVQEDDQAMLFVKIKSITSRAGKGE